VVETPTATLLLVDDDAMNRDALSRRLARTGYTVLTAESGVDALRKVGSHRIDAVLLDVMMPGMDGFETLRQLRRSRSISELPVIMVTANDRSADVVEALDQGANDYVTKPIDFPVVLARIRSQVNTRRSDPLTGLPNRVLFMEKIERALDARRAGTGGRFAVFFLDVDRFKIINDSLGHLVGDQLLAEIARRLEASLRAGDMVARYEGGHTLARLGGDEFTILLENVPDATEALAVADRLQAALAQPFELHGREVCATVSIGLVMSDDRYQRADDMVRDADTAMYRAKALGKARAVVFDTSMLQDVEERLQVESDLRLALGRGELQIHYQPIVSLNRKELHGFEALLRWYHPTRGVVLPDGFIPIAEETGLIVPIGTWVLEEACRQMRAWDAEFPDYAGLMINVNLSSRQLMQTEFVDEVARILADTGLAPARLKLEVTESLVLESADTIVEVLNALRKLGVQLGLDDFGIGHSALSYLQRFPFQTLKIDRSFITGIEESGNTEIIRAIISLAAGLAMDVTAEGVETAEQVTHLRQLACEFGQGFYFYKPLVLAEASDMLRAQTWAPGAAG
jgi:diguanylate cyclase (GGDEF)-like protein